VTFVVEGEEESGSMNIGTFVQEHQDLLRCNGAIWEEGMIDHQGRPLMTLGKRGLLYVEFRVRTMDYNAHSGKANVLPNAAWRLHEVLASLRDENGRVRIPGFYDRLLPPSDRDLELLDALESGEELERINYGVRIEGGQTGAAYKRAVFEPTCNIAGLRSGYIEQGSMTIVPADAMAKVDFRLLPDQNPKDIFQSLRAYLDDQGFADVEIESMGPMWPAKVSPDDPLVHLALSTGAEVYGWPGQITPISWGSSPMHEFIGPLGGIPVVEAGVGYPGTRSHGANEHVRLQDFLNGARHIARIVDGFASLPA
jgi:acetylornithine deacetylase/succinyl-diaminopimelate desuccinylase-like protein